jgi:hypothetical protein
VSRADLVITYGDTFTVARDEDGYLAVKVQNAAFVEEPRWILPPMSERDRYLDALIAALKNLRDTPDDKDWGNPK